MESGNKKLLSSSLRGEKIEQRFLEEHSHHMSVPLPDLDVFDTGGVTKARGATSHGRSLQKLQWNSQCDERCSDVPMTLKARCWMFAL